jgi:hypothetical protein
MVLDIYLQSLVLCVYYQTETLEERNKIHSPQLATPVERRSNVVRGKEAAI